MFYVNGLRYSSKLISENTEEKGEEEEKKK